MVMLRMLRRDLWHLRSQVAAAAVVVACGIAALVAMRSAWDSLEAARDVWYLHGRLGDVFVPATRVPERLRADLAAVDGVAAVHTRISARATLAVPGLDEPATIRVVSIGAETPGPAPSAMGEPALIRGRLPDPARDDEVLVSETFARANGLQPGDRLPMLAAGRRRLVTLTGTGLSVEHVYEIAPGMLFPDNRRYGVVWMPRAAAAAAWDLRGAFNDAVLALAPGAREADVIAAADRLTRPWGGGASHGRDDLASYRFLDDEFAEIRVNATVIPGVFLGVAAFLLFIVLSRLVAMQRAQIALLKAFGYGDRTVGAYYLGFAAAVVAIGAGLGTALGALSGRWLVELYGSYFHFPSLAFRLGPESLVLAAGVAALAASLGALAAVRRAAGLPPAEAMRPEAPPTFRLGRLDPWLARARLPASLRPVVRSLRRRPGRAVLAVIAMALAVATMVLGRFGVDASSALLARQLDGVQREDVAVAFDRALGDGAIASLAGLPGVLRVEPYRAVAVRLRHEHRSRRIGLTGLDPDSELRGLVDAQGRRFALPPDGIVLGTRLARVLDVAVGDRVDVDVLEGRRERFELPVVAVVDELLGLNAYADRSALTRRLGEPGTLDGAWLRVDPTALSTLYGTLQRLPRVASVATRDAMRDAIRQALDRSFRVMTVVMLGFAGAIVFGVVYNSARVTLSERGNELASLRVLGFTDREVATQLLGEQALLVAAAAPLGLAAGWGLCAALVPAFDRDLFRLPLVIAPETWLWALATLLVAALLSAALVARRIRHLDLVAVLKTRE